MSRNFKQVLSTWIEEMEARASNWRDGTPVLGLFESEELFRAGKEWLAQQPAETVTDTSGVEKTDLYRASEARELAQAVRALAKGGPWALSPGERDTLKAVAALLDNISSTRYPNLSVEELRKILRSKTGDRMFLESVSSADDVFTIQYAKRDVDGNVSIFKRPWAEFPDWMTTVEWIEETLRPNPEPWETPAERLPTTFEDTDVPGYMELRMVLERAYDQSARGKGKQRHARTGLPFLQQPIMEISRMVGLAGQTYQICKKAQEATTMHRNGNHEGAKAELLGAIVYSAAAYLLVEEQTPNDKE